MCEQVYVKVKHWEQAGQPVQTIRMDNVGENKRFVKMLNAASWQMYPTIEYTARDTPQYVYLAKNGFATMFERSRALMIKANVRTDKKHIVAPRAIETATKLDGLI